MTISRRFECCYSVFAFSKTLTSQGMEPPTLCLSFLPLSVSSIQYPIRTTYNIYMLSWYNSQILFLYVIQILVCRISWVENCLVHPVRLAISAALAQGWSVWRWSGKIENVGIFNSCTTASISCVDDVNTRTAFLARWEIPTDFGHLATHRLPTKKCADIK